MIKVNRNSKGFTLIELLIVIAIIGILAAIAIPAYTGYTKKSKMSGVTSAMGALKNAILAYYTETGSLGAAVTAAQIAGNFGISLPTQYISGTHANTNVAYTAATDTIVISVQQNVEPTTGGLVNLTGTPAGGTWVFNSDSTTIRNLLPK